MFSGGWTWQGICRDCYPCWFVRPSLPTPTIGTVKMCDTNSIGGEYSVSDDLGLCLIFVLLIFGLAFALTREIYLFFVFFEIVCGAVSGLFVYSFHRWLYYFVYSGIRGKRTRLQGLLQVLGEETCSSKCVT